MYVLHIIFESKSQSCCYLACLEIRMFYHLLNFLSKSMFSKKFFKKSIGVTNSLVPDHARHIVGHDQGTKCLDMLSADGSSR